MATTNFGRLLDEQLTTWSRDVWKAARNKSFLNNFVGSSADSMVQRITELKKSAKGARAVITLVPDLEGDGVVGDNQLEGNEEEIKAYDQPIRIDQLRNANRSEGRMAEQKVVVNFREQTRDLLSYWLADRMDQIAILFLSGVALSKKTDGTDRTGSQLNSLEFAADVTAPSTNRHRRWVAASNSLAAGATGSVVATDYPSWKMLVQAKAYAVDNFIRPIRTEDGIEVYNVFMTPQGIARLKQDADFLAAWQHAQKRGDENPLFKGTPHGGTRGIYIDGLNIMEYRHVYHASNWGAGSVTGQRVLFCGAQALAMADIGMPTWDEEMFDYGNSPGISVAKTFGFKKPVWRSQVTGTDEDFGVLCIDTAY
jgi:N4-gp56 family major capsid protein